MKFYPVGKELNLFSCFRDWRYCWSSGSDYTTSLQVNVSESSRSLSTRFQVLYSNRTITNSVKKNIVYTNSVKNYTNAGVRHLVINNELTIRKITNMVGDFDLSSLSWIFHPTYQLNLFPASHNFCCLLSHLLMFLGSLYSKQYGPRSDCSQGSSLIRIHSVCFHDNI